jgi:uncharacterized membrane protein YeiH
MFHADTVLHILAFVAYVAEGMTAALAAGRRAMDWVGVALLGAITALGGGSLRDVLLGHYPLSWVERPYLLGLTGGAALLTIALARVVHRFRLMFLVLDAIGLVVATMCRCCFAASSMPASPWSPARFMSAAMRSASRTRSSRWWLSRSA